MGEKRLKQHTMSEKEKAIELVKKYYQIITGFQKKK